MSEQGPGSNMPRLRLGYRKSRTGCLRCRQRKVKCDENRPCGACVRHRITCSLVSVSPTASANSSTVDPVPQDSGTVAVQTDLKLPDAKDEEKVLDLGDPALRSLLEQAHSTISPTGSNPFPYFDKFVSTQTAHYTGSWTADLELLHHFTISTCMTLPKSSQVSRIWQVDVPRLAFSNTYLMHQLLALSGYHLAQQHPEKCAMYSLQGSLHQNEGIQGMRKALGEITPDSCHALFATSCLLCFGVFASLSFPGAADNSPTVQGLIDAFLLVKGMSGILNTYEETLRRGPLGLVFGPGAPVSPSNDSLIAIAVQKVKVYADSLDDFGLDPAVKAVVNAEVDALSRWINLAANSTTYAEIRTVMTWPISMSEEYISLIRQRHPAALALMTYYCVILHATGGNYWFVRGWGSSVAKDIECALPSQWRDVVRWPMAWIRDHAGTKGYRTVVTAMDAM